MKSLLDKSKSRTQEKIQPKEIKKQSTPLTIKVTEKVEQMIGYFNEIYDWSELRRFELMRRIDVIYGIFFNLD